MTRVEAHKQVTVTYRLDIEGELVQEATAHDPFSFIHGIGHTLPQFDAAIAGKQVGDTVSFQLAPNDAYGMRNESLIQTVDRGAFAGAPEGTLEEGNILSMELTDVETGKQEMLPGTVVKVEEDVVYIDFNHPLAERTLDYTVTILSVEDAPEN